VKGNVGRRVDWLQEYVSHYGTGRILTDFDEQETTYRNAVFSLERIFDARLDLREISDVIDRDGDQFGSTEPSKRDMFFGNVRFLTINVQQANIERIDMGDTNIGGDMVTGTKNDFRGVFHNSVAGTVYAKKMDDCFNSFAARQPNEELQTLVSQLHQQVESLIERLKEGSPDQADEVADTLVSFTDEVGKDIPNKTTLRALGTAIVDVAKKVAEVATPVATAVAAVLKLVGVAAL
jgi:hypothetical protein